MSNWKKAVVVAAVAIEENPKVTLWSPKNPGKTYRCIGWAATPVADDAPKGKPKAMAAVLTRWPFE